MDLQKLLEEIPRATSAPPHLQEPLGWALVRCRQPGPHGRPPLDLTPPFHVACIPKNNADAFHVNQQREAIADIRFDEDYARWGCCLACQSAGTNACISQVLRSVLGAAKIAAPSRGAHFVSGAHDAKKPRPVPLSERCTRATQPHDGESRCVCTCYTCKALRSNVCEQHLKL